MSKTRFVAVVFNLSVNEDLGDGLEIESGIRLTNNAAKIRSLITADLAMAMGGLELNALHFANAAIYADVEIKVDETNNDKILCDIIGRCKMFFQDLWLIKDHCVDIEMCYLIYSNPLWNPLLIDQSIPEEIVHSNLLTSGYSTAKGETRELSFFGKNEILSAINLYEKDNRKIIPFSESDSKATFHEKGTQRITLASILIQTGRLQKDIGLKISQYCTAMEALFATDTMELSHRLSERIAFFIEEQGEKRKEMYKTAKEIYGIRSKIVHGSTIGKNESELKSVSVKADNILRSAFVKIIQSPNLDSLFRSAKSVNAELDEFFLNLIFEVGI